MKVAIYSRVSDDKLKADGERRQDVQRQVEMLKPMAEAWLKLHPDWDQEVSVYIDDGKSAFKEDYNSRPDFCKIMRESRAHRIQRLYVESLDRWSRRVVDGLTTLKECEECGLTVVSIAEGEIDWTTPQGWFKSLIALGFAEWASRDKSWKVKNAMDRRANDSRMACRSCSTLAGKEVIHLGRHPLTCECPKCRARTARSSKEG